MPSITNTTEALAFIAEDYAKLRARLDDAIPKPQKHIPYDVYPTDLFKYALEYVNNGGEYQSRSSWSKSFNESCTTVERVQERRDRLVGLIDAALLAAEEIKIQNAEITAHNQRVIAKVTDIMSHIGIPSQYSSPYTYRGKTKHETKAAGYRTDLLKYVAVTCGFSATKAKLDDKKRQIVDWASKAMRAIQEEERARKATEAEKKKELFLSTAKVRYGLNFDADQSEVRRAILQSNKYLRLASDMLFVREGGGWSSVKTLLYSFKVETEIDNEIEEDIQNLIDRWSEGDGDSRSVRDTKWGYDALFALAAEQHPQSYADLQTYDDLFNSYY